MFSEASAAFLRDSLGGPQETCTSVPSPSNTPFTQNTPASRRSTASSKSSFSGFPSRRRGSEPSRIARRWFPSIVRYAASPGTTDLRPPAKPAM